MTIETFDQRFKRLTSDMLMIDLCRLLGIEIRQLMKIRSGVRVELSMSGLRKLCEEQGLDVSSFIRGYNDPWSSELAPTEVITSDSPVEAPALVGSATNGQNGKPIFRPDGSRILQPAPKRAAAVETVRSSGSSNPPSKPAAPKSTELAESPRAAAPPKKLQVSFRPTKPAPAPTVPEKYEPDAEDDIYFEDDDTRPSIASRLREAVSSAFRRSDAQSEQAELYSGVTPARAVTTSGSSLATTQESAAPAVIRTQEREIQNLISEVSSLRREINHLSSTVRELLER